MNNLDLLISSFKEAKEELAKGDSVNPLTPTEPHPVETFLHGLKALPKGSPERGKFITQHMNHAPFISSLSNHPQGKQIHAMLTTHLNSAANAGPKAFGGAKVMVKSEQEDIVEQLEKAMIGGGSQTSAMRGGGSTQLQRPNDTSRADMFNAALNGEFQPKTAPKPVAKPAGPVPTKLTGIDRIKAVAKQPFSKADLLKQSCGDVPFGKTVNTSSAALPQQTLSLLKGCEKLSLNKGGQWNLDKTAEDGRSGSEKLCPKCHAKKCQCNNEGILVD